MSISSGSGGAALRDRASDVHDHCDDALRDESGAVAAHRDGYLAGSQKTMSGIPEGGSRNGCPHDRAALHHRKHRVHCNGALGIEPLFRRARRRVFPDGRNEDQCIRTGTLGGLERRSKFLQKLGQDLVAALVCAAHPDAPGISRWRRRLGRHDGFHLRVVVVKAFLRLAPQHAGLVSRAHDEVGPVARLLEKLVIDELRRGLRDIEPRQLHQLEGPHAKAADVAHDAIDVGKARDAFMNEMRCLQREAAAHLVHEKARRIREPHRLARHAPADDHERLGHPVFGQKTVDHFDELHQRHRIEEMKAAEALRCFELGCDSRHRQRRRVRGEYAIGRDDVFELREKLALRLEVFHDGFDHDMARLEVGKPIDDLDAAWRRPPHPPAHAALLCGASEHLRHEVARFLRRAGPRVGDQHVHAARGGDLNDAAPHRAGADHADGQVRPVCIECH